MFLNSEILKNFLSFSNDFQNYCWNWDEKDCWDLTNQIDWYGEKTKLRHYCWTTLPYGGQPYILREEGVTTACMLIYR